MNVDWTVVVDVTKEVHAIKGQSLRLKSFLMERQGPSCAAVEDGGWWVEVPGCCKYLDAL